MTNFIGHRAIAISRIFLPFTYLGKIRLSDDQWNWSFGHRVIAISRIFLKDQWKFLPWWLLSKSEYNGDFHQN